MSDDISALQDRYVQFLEARDWEHLHTPENVAMALSVEASELVECFLWHDNLPADAIAEDPELVAEIESEVADVVIYAMSMAHQLEFDLTDAVEAKLDENEARFDEDRAADIRTDLQRFQRD